MDVTDLGSVPRPAAASGTDPALVSFSEQVPASSRITVREQVLSMGCYDPIFDGKVDRPDVLEEEDATQTAVVFHPEATKLIRFKQALERSEIPPETADAKRRRLEETKEKDIQMVDQQVDVLHAMQEGAHQTPSAPGAQTLQHVDLLKFRDYIRQKIHQDLPVNHDVAALDKARVELDQAKAASAKLHAEHQSRRKLLAPLSTTTFDCWPTSLRQAFESNYFAPGNHWQAPEEYEWDHLKKSYLTMKEFLRDNRCPVPGRMLLQEMPSCQLDLLETSSSLDAAGSSLAKELPLDSEERKLAMMDAIMSYHIGEVRAWGGKWELRDGPLEEALPTWAKPSKRAEVEALEARTNPTNKDLWEPSPWQPADIAPQISDGTRPAPDTVVGLFWAPCDARMVAHGTNQVPQHFVRRVQSWDLPSLITCFGQAKTFKELYMVWNQMPICISGKRRGEDTEAIKAKRHKEIQHRNHTLRDMGRFLKVIRVPFPKSNDDIRTLYREMGSFLAASVILAHTPLEVMNMPEAGIQDSKEQMRFRAVCDERISLPLSAFKDHGDIYQKLAARLGQQSMLEVRVAWRCNHPLWWVAVADDTVAPDLYRKLGYSEETVAALMALDSVPTVAPGTEGAVYPPLSVANVSSIASADYKRKHFGNKNAHVFWGKADCGLILSSLSPWELRTKESGVTKGGWMCKACRGFWKAGTGASRFVQITGHHKGKEACLQLILDEPPERLYNEWVKSRLEFYKRIEPTAPPRDIALQVDPDLTNRLMFSCQNNMGLVSSAIWQILLQNPELASLQKIGAVAAAHSK